MKQTNETQIVCPVCGASFAIAEHEHTVENATVIGKDSGLGTIQLPLAKEALKQTKAADRLAALKAAGFDTTGLFAMQGASGDGEIVRMNGNSIEAVSNDDPIFDIIRNGGTIPERRLFRRWVMSQMFHMMAMKRWNSNLRIGVTEAIRRKGYEYTWTMMLEEFRVQSVLFNKDREAFDKRNRGFSQKVAVATAEHYIEELKRYVGRLKKRHCKGVEYVRLRGENIFTEDLGRKVYGGIRSKLWSIKYAKTPQDLYKALREFDKVRIPLNHRAEQCPAWVDAFKFAGAYYTLENLILFHGVTLEDRYGVKFNKYQSMDFLECKAEMHKDGEGYMLLGLLKDAIKKNGIDIDAKIASWRK